MNTDNELSSKKCVPCEGGIDSLNKDECQKFIQKLDSDWNLSKDNKKISKSFKFKNHYEVISLVNMIAWISHSEDHHPEINFSYNTVLVTYYTYAIDGLSENDFICAAKIDKSLVS